MFPPTEGGGENLYIVGSGGDVRPIGLAAGNVAISDVTFSPDGRSAAYVASSHAGACETISSPVLIDLATGAHTELPPPGDLAIEGAGIRDLWYDEDGTLNMIFTSWRCEASGGAATSVVVPESRWRLAGSAWTQQEPGSPGNVRDVGPGYRAVLVMPDLETFTGELFSEIDGVRTRIADEVLAIAVPE